MKNKKLIIFDMDGTLIDSSLTIANAINYVRSRLGLVDMPYERIISHVNDHTIDTANFFYEVDQFEPIHEKWFSEYYSQNHDKELRLYDGIPQLLDWLKERGVMIALATNAYHNSTVESLRHFGIAELFDTIICADDVEQGKPAPEMLYRILDELQITMHEALFVGDGPRDEDAARAANMDYLMVDWGFTEHDTDKNVISSVDELKSVFGKLVDF